MNLCTLERDLKLEVNGIQAYPSVTASDLVREILGLQGTTEELLEQVSAHVRRVMLERIEDAQFGHVEETDTHAKINGVDVEKSRAEDLPDLEVLLLSGARDEGEWSAENEAGEKVPLETCVLCGGPCVGRYMIECTNGGLSAVNQEQRDKLTSSQNEKLINGPGYMGIYPVGMACAQNLPKRFYWIEKDKQLLIEECKHED